uniref:SH3 and multiple ankyrin repeat domains 2b n=1 Tax=Astyanax mexicanus TaxID=7994 RepID=A0A8B9KMM1_ASTMX
MDDLTVDFRTFCDDSASLLNCWTMPFREAPAVCSGRGRQQQQPQTGRSTLTAPRVLLRSNSDNNLNVNKLPAPRSPSRSPSPLRSLSPRRPQQMQNSPNGTVKTMGRGSRPPRSRSPSLGRLGEGDARRQHTPQRHSRSVSASPKISDARADRSERRKLFRHYTVGSYDSFDASSVCLYERDSLALKSSKPNSGGIPDTPIEEFTPTPAFPALQYLESVDEGGVAWQAGLRTGDFLIEVNQDNVVKVGHKQVVNMIRHGGNHLIIKVVTVSRNLDPDDKSRKKGKLIKCQDVSVDSPPVTGSPKGPYLGVPKGTIRRQTSIASCYLTTGVTEEEKQFLTPPMLKFTRSLSMPDTSEDIPPPPAISPPSPPHNSGPAPAGRGYGTIRAGFTAQTPATNSTPPERGGDSNIGSGWREQGMFYRDSPEQYDSEACNSPTAQQSLHMRRAQIPENPYSDVGKGHSALFVPNKPARRKGMLVKQSNVEDSPEKTCSIPIPTIIIKEPSTSSSGKSSQGSSMEIETSTPEHTGQLRPEDGLNTSSPFATAMVSSSAREKRLEVHRNSPSFRSTDAGDEDVTPTPAPRLRHSKSIDEGMFSSDERLRRLMAPPSSLLSIPRGGGNVTDFNSPEPTMVRELLNTRTGHSPISLPAHKTYSSGGGNYVHPVTGKPLDPNSPLALALAARDRAMREQSQPLPLKSDPSKLDLNKPLFIDTKLRSNVDVSFSSTATMGRPRGGLRRQMTESKYETESKYQLDLGKPEKRVEEKKNMLIDIVDTSQQKSAGLLMVHTTDGAKSEENSLSEGERDEDICPDSTPGELRDPNQPAPVNPPPSKPTAPQGKTIITISSVDEPVKLPFGIPPPPLASVDIDEEFVFGEPLPPPLEFANSFDIPEDQAGAISELLKQKANGIRRPSLGPYYPHLNASNSEIKRPTVLTNCTPPSFPTGPLEPYEPIIDSGIEVDSRSSGDPQLETTSTVSTVSSISTLSSEGGETLDTCTVYADGQAFMVDRAQVLPKPKAKHAVNKSNALYKDTLNEESVGSFRVPSSVPPPPPGTAPPEPLKTPTQRTSKLWGEPLDLKNPHGPEAKPQGMSEMNSVLQHVNKDKAPKPGEALDSPTGCRTHFGSRYVCTTTSTSTSSSLRPERACFPFAVCASSSSLPASAASPTMTDVFGLPTPPLSLGTGRSRSPSPLTLIQAASNKPFATKPVLAWSKQDVADWLESLNLAEHRDAFMDNDIEGSHLPSLQKQDLIDLGVTRVGHRMNIERALKLLLDR